jgi:hypothetical protein
MQYVMFFGKDSKKVFPKHSHDVLYILILGTKIQYLNLLAIVVLE